MVEGFARAKLATERRSANTAHGLGKKNDFEAGLPGGELERFRGVASRHVEGARCVRGERHAGQHEGSEAGAKPEKAAAGLGEVASKRT